MRFKISVFLLFFLSFALSGQSALEQSPDLNERLRALKIKMDELKTRQAKFDYRLRNLSNLRDSAQTNNANDFEKKPPLNEISGKNKIEKKPVSEPEPFTPEQKGVTKKNSLIFNYSFCSPHTTNFKEYKMEYNTGHSLDLRYQRNYDLFFWGLSTGIKQFNSKKISNIPYLGELSATGGNFSWHTSLLTGFKYHLMEEIFVQGTLGLGLNKSQEEITLLPAGATYSEDTYNLYSCFGLATGFHINEFLSLLIFYQIDATGPSGHLSTKLFSQAGIGIGLNY